MLPDAGTSPDSSAEGGAPATEPSSAGRSAPVGGSSSAGGRAPSSTAGSGGVGGTPLAAGSGGAGGAPAEGPKVNDTKIPCPVIEALTNACYRCHGPMPINGAPMALTAWEDFQRNSIVKPKPPLYEVARMRIDGSRMPLMPPGGAIAPEDKKTLLDWLGNKAPAATTDEPCR